MIGCDRVSKKLIVFAAFAAALVAPQAAQATISSVFDGDVACTVQGDGVRFCGSSTPRSTSEAWDGVPIDVNVAFPPEPASGPDGDFPLVMMFHGYGGGKIGLGGMQHWLDKGYATFSMTDRGFRESCGSAASKAADPSGCANGYVRLIDNRYEVRDAQEFAGRLADEGAGLIDPQRIAAIGGSYGGGMSMALGALKDRMVMPDYSVVPWKSPAGKALEIAATAPNIPWTDLAYSLAPNGSTLDYVTDAPYTGRVGVSKQSYVSGLFLSGLGAPGFYAPEGSDPTADLIGWRDRLNEGEPYGPESQAIIDELTQHHSSYYIDHSEKPAPMLMSSGFTDDLFPADETIRYYNRTKAEYPDADLALFFGDFGHPRAQNKPDVTGALDDRQDAWIDYYLKGEGTEPRQGVEAYTETCPGSEPSGGPYTAKNWASIAPGEVRYSDPAEHTIAADSSTGGAFNPTSTGACATTPSADTEGAAIYELDPAPDEGYTLMGAVSVVAKFELSGDTSQVAARLLDMAPDGTESLVDRGLWRPAEGGPTKQVFQLHPNGWTFAGGHVPKLELIAADGTVVNTEPFLTSYGRPSNDQQDVTVSDLEMRMPVLEKPGTLGGLVGAPAPKYVPQGYDLAPDFAALRHPNPRLLNRKLRVSGKGKIVKPRVKCPKKFDSCHAGRLTLKARDAGFKMGSAKFGTVDGGGTPKLTIRLTKRARKYIKTKHRRLAFESTTSVAEVAKANHQRGKIIGKKIRR
ncbi:MAG: acetylxylan esterase [Solirubrobacterales bacterium]|nr:acetylxylan esterase [Solirubrobacterales bacterium]